MIDLATDQRRPKATPIALAILSGRSGTSRRLTVSSASATARSRGANKHGVAASSRLGLTDRGAPPANGLSLPNRLAPRGISTGREAIPRPPSRHRERQPLLPIIASPPIDTRRWRGYQRPRQASNIFPRKAAPHVALVLLDLARRERNAQAGPEALNAFEWPPLGHFGAEAGSMAQDLLLLLGR